MKEMNMAILNSIKEKIFGKKKASEAELAQPAQPEQPAAPTSAEISASMNKMAEKMQAAMQAAKESVDIEAVLEAAVKAKGVKLNWRTSIVDLMKALDLDSSLTARKELAADLNYSGPHADGSAEKNIWLHKELMKTLAANGGKIPKELLN